MNLRMVTNIEVWWSCRFPQRFEQVEELLLSGIECTSVSDIRQIKICKAESLVCDPGPSNCCCKAEKV
jgi:hypothetical protein